MNRKSFSLVEVIVAAVILSLAFGGLFAAFIAARSYSTYSTERTIAANLARRALEDLYDGVSADNWDTGILRTGANPHQDDEYDIGGQLYGDNNSSFWDVNPVPGHQYRQVDMEVGYTTSSGGQIGIID
jgi:Tfp pilus assembly protein PilV